MLARLCAAPFFCVLIDDSDSVSEGITLSGFSLFIGSWRKVSQTQTKLKQASVSNFGLLTVDVDCLSVGLLLTDAFVSLLH